EVFNEPGTFKWTAPDGANVVYISGVGAGGGGSGGVMPTFSTYPAGGNAGEGGESVYRRMVLIEDKEEIEVTVGEGGKKGLGRHEHGKDGDSGKAGGISSFGNLITLSGGSGGDGPSASSGKSNSNNA